MKKIALLFLLIWIPVLCLFSCSEVDFYPYDDVTNTTTILPTNSDGSCEHSFSEWSLAVPSTCEQQGRMVRVCEYCAEEETMLMALSAHSEVIDPAVVPSCTTDGLTEGRHCTVCGIVTVPQETIFAEHNNANEDNLCDSCGVTIFSQGLFYSLSLDRSYYIVSGMGTCKDTTIVIPSNHNGLPVKEIGGEAFKATNITSVFIPKGITTIGTYAFRDCTFLEQVIISNSVSAINYGSFYGCSSLKGVSIPDSVVTIGEYAFRGCYSLEQVNIPDSVITLGYGAFCYCTSLTQATISNSVTIIEEFTFGYCSSLMQVSIPSSITNIGYGAFCGCSSLTKVVIPNGVVEIGEYAFSKCGSLEEINIPNSVSTIGYAAFSGSKALTRIVFETSDGWRCTWSDNETVVKEFSVAELSDHGNAANYLRNVYSGYK